MHCSFTLQSLLSQALQQDKDAAVAKFCFMSESCVPIAALDRTLDGVLADECSWVNYASKQNDGYAWQKQVCSYCLLYSLYNVRHKF